MLVYFDIIGICWPIRCLLHLKRVDYELVQVPILAWIQQNDQGERILPRLFRNDHMPVYVDEDVYLTQSNVILQYLGENHDMLGDTMSERLAALDHLHTSGLHRSA